MGLKTDSDLISGNTVWTDCISSSSIMTVTLVMLITLATNVDKEDTDISIWTNASDSFTH